MMKRTSRWTLRPWSMEFLCFGAVGAAGFAIDVMVLSVALILGFNLYSGRLISYFLAATGTWYGNRILTFRHRRSPGRLGEWLRFLIVNLPGAAANYGVYALLVTHLAMFAAVPALAVAAGSVCGLIVNFIGSRRIAFVPER